MISPGSPGLASKATGKPGKEIAIEFDAGHLLLSPGFSLNLPPRSAIQSPSDFNETVSSKIP